MKNTMTKMYGKNKFFRFLGNDFEEFLTTQFQALEKTFYQLNIGSRKQCPEYKYGNPSDYMVKFNQFYARHELPVRKWDFMPNWDQGHYWTGYFTTEPDLKKLCKDFSRLLNLYRKIFLKYYDPKADLTGFKTYLRKAEQLLAVMQHHDGITATSKLKIEELFKKRIRTMTQILN